MAIFYLEKPDDLLVQVEVSTVFMEWEGKLLLLERHVNKGGSQTCYTAWGIPGGKLEAKETPLEALVREIKEELHVDALPSALKQVNSFYVRQTNISYRLHLFRWKLLHQIAIQLNPQEHLQFCWQPIEQFSHLPLLDGQLEAFEAIYKR